MSIGFETEKTGHATVQLPNGCRIVIFYNKREVVMHIRQVKIEGFSIAMPIASDDQICFERRVVIGTGCVRKVVFIKKNLSVFEPFLPDLLYEKSLFCSPTFCFKIFKKAPILYAKSTYRSIFFLKNRCLISCGL